MTTLLNVWAILAAGSLLLSIAVFAGAARRFVSNEPPLELSGALRSGLPAAGTHWRELQERDRRRGGVSRGFKRVIDGKEPFQDRRINSQGSNVFGLPPIHYR